MNVFKYLWSFAKGDIPKAEEKPPTQEDLWDKIQENKKLMNNGPVFIPRIKQTPIEQILKASE